MGKLGFQSVFQYLVHVAHINRIVVHKRTVFPEPHHFSPHRSWRYDGQLRHTFPEVYHATRSFKRETQLGIPPEASLYDKTLFNE